VGIEGGIGFFHDGSRQSVVADHDHRIEVVGLSAVNLALGGSQLNMGHAAIIPAWTGKHES
jgi:hypothetical protein